MARRRRQTGTARGRARRVTARTPTSAAATIALLVALLGSTASAQAPISRAAAVCSDYPNQAAAQRAKDTRDADGDGVYCETLPCPCSRPGSGRDGGGNKPRAQRIEARIRRV